MLWHVNAWFISCVAFCFCSWVVSVGHAVADGDRKTLRQNALITYYSTDGSFLFNYPSQTAYEVMKEVTLLAGSPA